MSISGLDFYGFLLPWIFTFAIVYGLLMKANIFGNANKQVSVALSFVIAFFVTGLGGPQLALFFTNLFGGASVFLGGILVILLFVSMLGYGENGAFKHIAALILVIVIGAILFIASTGSMTGGQIYIDSYTATVIFWIIIIIVAAYLITRGGGQETQSSAQQPGQSR